MIRRDFLKLSSLTAGSACSARCASAFASHLPWGPTSAMQSAEPESNVPEQDAYDIFAHPEMKYRPFVRWWWNGDRISGDELLRELDVLKAAGIGGVEINPIKFPDEADPMGIPSLTWLSDEWISMLKIALDGAKQRGMICDMIVGSGWPYGGEFLSRDDQTQIVALETRNLSGPQSLIVSRQELIDSCHPAFGFPYRDPLKQLVGLRLVPAQMNGLNQSLNLDANIQQDSIQIEVPQGDHVLYSLVKITGFMAVINGAPGASGPVLNHYDGHAVERYLTRLSDKLSAKLGPLNNCFRSFFTDSIELEGANWCDDMLVEFRRRRGYDLSPWLPFILFKVGEMGNAVKERYGAAFTPELQRQIELVRFDFETTKHELFQDRFIRTFASWCTRIGVKSRMQAYGMDCDPIASGMLVDIPECETWIRSEKVDEFGSGDYTRGRSYTMINKFVSSSAHLSGKRLISAEDMTNTDDPFHTSLERIKIGADQSMLSGVTHSVLHGFNYSPLDAPFPGWVRYGTYFSERNPWWPYFKLWTDYKARLSAIFQHSVMQAQIAILPPAADLAEKYGFQRDPFPRVAYPPYLHKIWEAVHQNGNGCDYLSEDIIQKSSVNNGQLTFNGRSYGTMLLPEVESLSPSTAVMLHRFAESGGKLIFIGKAPHLATGLTNNAVQSKAVENTFNTILKKLPRTTAIVPINEQDMVGWYRDLQQKFSLEPTVAIDKPKDFMSQLHYVSGDRDIFFFINYGPDKSNTFEAAFNTADKTAWLWDPETGERYLYPSSSSKNRLTITLAPSESKLIVFEPASLNIAAFEHRALSSFSTDTIKSGITQAIVHGPWQITLSHVNGTAEALEFQEPHDFTLDDHLKSFAGTVVYRNHFLISDPNQRYWLDFGRLHCVSELEINGIPQGSRWYGDHLYEISSAIRAGKNYLSIKLVTTLGNYMKTLKHNKAAEVWTKHTPFVPMGLIEPVHLLSRL
jgi:hypothetical protein